MNTLVRITLMIIGYIAIYQTVGTVELMDIVLVTVGGLLITMAQHIED
jgi:hypothetical protein